MPDRVADAYEALAAEDGMFTTSDHVRLALSNHLRALGIDFSAASAPRPNGHQHLEAAE